MERDYASLIPTEPPAGLMDFLRREGNFECGVMGFRWIGREEAEARTFCDEFGGDFRPRELLEGRKRHKAALLWCSECDAEMVAEYVSEEGCGRYGGPGKGIRIEEDYQQTSGEYQEYHEMRCPHCGEKVTLLGADALYHGRTEQAFAVALTVGRDGAEPLPVLTEWRVERKYRWKEAREYCSAFSAYVVDGKRIIKLARYRRGLSGFYRLDQWERLKQAKDKLGVPYFLNEMPDLAGTSLENAKLPEYYAQAYDKDLFFPLGYIRLYQRRPNIENLITSGLGEVVGQAIRDEANANMSYSTSLRIPVLRWIRWKEKRPAQMLGLTREQLRQTKAAKWDAERYRFWAQQDGAMRFDAAMELLRCEEPRAILEMIQDGADPMRTVRYLKKQQQSYHYLQDYRRMARRAELDLTQEVIVWPPHLREAHDRVQQEVRYQVSGECREQFAEMSKRCAGLRWEHDGICIRPAATPEELIEEGATLHHCVGGYAERHASGSIILFVRHTRRPERSWYTLNVSVHKKMILQLHGYGNERSPKGKKLRIPREVREFVALWEKEVLWKWVLPEEKKATGKGRKSGTAA